MSGRPKIGDVTRRSIRWSRSRRRSRGLVRAARPAIRVGLGVDRAAPPRRGSSRCSVSAQLGGARGSTAAGGRWRRRSLRALQRDLLAEALVRLLLIARRASPAGRSRSASSTCGVAVEQANRDPARVRHAGRGRLDERHQLGDRALELRRARRPAAAWSRSSPDDDAVDRRRAARACLRRCARRSATAGTPRSRDRLRTSTSMPLRRASSIRLTATTTRSVISSTCSTRFRLRSSAVASMTTMVHVGPAEQQEVARDLLVAATPRAASRCRADRRACSGPC